MAVIVTKIVLPLRRGAIKDRLNRVRSRVEDWMWDHSEIISVTIIAVVMLAAAIYVASLFPPPYWAGR